MVLRTTICSAALAMGLAVNLSAAAAACEGAGCSAKAKPLDIMQFMREQAASTRTAKPRTGPSRTTAKAQRAPHRAVAAQRKPVSAPTPLPVEAAASFASRPEQDAQPSTSEQFTPIGRTANTAPAETTGMATPTWPNVRFVDAEEFNEIDRKAENGAPLTVNAVRGDPDRAQSDQTNTSWLRWIWSALGSTFAALATAVRQLIHV